MATQRYRDRSDETVGLNELTPSVAPGHAPEKQPAPGAENKTPAPLSTAELARVKDTAWGRAGDQPGDQNPGKNGYGGASSLSPGQRAPAAKVNPLAPRDAVLDAVIARGTARAGALNDDWQVRRIEDTQLPAAGGLVKRGIDSGSPGGTVPASTGMTSSDADERRAAALQRASGRE